MAQPPYSGWSAAPRSSQRTSSSRLVGPRGARQGTSSSRRLESHVLLPTPTTWSSSILAPAIRRARSWRSAIVSISAWLRPAIRSTSESSTTVALVRAPGSPRRFSPTYAENLPNHSQGASSQWSSAAKQEASWLRSLGGCPPDRPRRLTRPCRGPALRWRYGGVVPCLGLRPNGLRW